MADDLKTLLESIEADLRFHEGKAVELRTVQAYLREKLGTNGAMPPSPPPRKTNGKASKTSRPVMTQVEIGKKALETLGRKAKINEIVDFAIKHSLVPEPKNYRNLSNSFYGALTRTPAVFVRVEPGTFDLKERASK